MTKLFSVALTAALFAFSSFAQANPSYTEMQTPCLAESYAVAIRTAGENYPDVSFKPSRHVLNSSAKTAVIWDVYLRNSVNQNVIGYRVYSSANTCSGRAQWLGTFSPTSPESVLSKDASNIVCTGGSWVHGHKAPYECHYRNPPVWR